MMVAEDLKDETSSEYEYDPIQLIKTEWKGIALASFIFLLSSMESTMIQLSEWSYMQEIDKEAVPDFLGFVQFSSQLFHAIGSVLFTIHCHQKRSFKSPLIAGRIISLLACLLFLSVEMFDEGRRYIMALCNILFSIASSTSTVLRAYVAGLSLHGDRPAAFSYLNGANTFATIIGPVIPIFFSSFQYPGIEIYPRVKFHIYSAPIWVAAASNLLSCLLIQCCLYNLPLRRTKKTRNKIPVFGIKSWLNREFNTKFDWSILILCWIEKMICTLSSVILTSLISVILMTNYGWSRAESVVVTIKTMMTVTVLALVIPGLYIFGRLGRYIKQRHAFLIGMFTILSLFLFSYPWESVSNPVAVYNTTSRIGCNPEEYSWCSTSYAPAAPLFLIITVIVMGVGFPMSTIALDSAYAGLLGPIDQNVMQGAMIVSEDFILILGPVYATEMYTRYGLESLWAWNGVILAFGALLWIINLVQIKKYS